MRTRLRARICFTSCFTAGLLVGLLAGTGCGHTHRPPLPAAAEVLEQPPPASLPRVYSVVTAVGEVERGSVLEAGGEEGFELVLGAFVLAWPDGRLLLIDAGSDTAAAEEVSGLARLAGVLREPLAQREQIAELLGPASKDVAAVVFSHLHTDHTAGLPRLCEARGGAPLAVYLVEGQSDDALRSRSKNLEDGWGHVKNARCAQPHALPEGALVPLNGFEGIWVARAAGHTNGSLVVFAHVLDREGRPVRMVFAGDIVNALDSIKHEPTVPKPWYYRLAGAEDETRLVEVRALLRELRESGVVVVPAHDLGATRRLEEEGALTPWSTPGTTPAAPAE